MKSSLFPAYMAVIFTSAAPFVLADSIDPPQTIYGNYARQVEDCYIGSSNEEKPVCEKNKVRDFLIITKGKNKSIDLKLKLHFFNGHTCEMDGPARWSNGHLEVIDFNADGTPDFCYLDVEVSKLRITLHDPDGKCTRGYCGTRGMLEGVILERENVGHR
jgi:hypothetical protein